MTLRAALRAATIALFATAASVAMPAPIRAQDITCEPGDLEVRGLEFRGNRAIGDDDLALRVTTTPSSWGRRRLHLWFAEKRCLNRAELPRDVLRLEEFYRKRGYQSAKVDTIVEPLGREAVRVIFSINEGEPTRLASYAVSGLEGIADSADMVRRLQLKVGQPFDELLYRADIDSIVRRLRDAGYYRADALLGFDADSVVRRAEASITVLPGKRARFGEPRFQIDTLEGRGQQLATAVVRRVLGIAPGELYSDRAIVDAQRNLFQLGTYRHIEVAPLPDSSQPPGDTIVVLAVRLTEDYMRQVDSEFGWATLDCGRVRLQYTDKNWLRTARRFELTAQASKIGYGYPVATAFTRNLCTFDGRSPLASDSTFSSKLYYFTGFAIRQPQLLGTRWVPTLSVYSERRGEFKAYLRSTQVGADLSATRELGVRMPLRAGYSFEYGQTKADPPALCALFNRCDPASRDQIQKLLPLGVASATLARVRVDNVISPSRGYLMRSEVRSSASRLLGTSDSLFFNKATGDVVFYRPIWRNVLAIRLRGGAVLGRRLSLSDSTGFIPPQERLYAGGPTSTRGFQQNELGSLVYITGRSNVDSAMVGPPAGADTIYRFFVSANPDSVRSPERAVPLGGNSLLVANIEYRIRDPFFFPNLLQYTLFLDGGDVWTRGDRTLVMKWTPGIGVRALTPVGPVQVNIGYNQYGRERGPIYYNPNVLTLACATPGNNLTYRRGPSTNGQLVAVNPNASCPDTFTPPTRRAWYQKLTFTFSIGTDF